MQLDGQSLAGRHHLLEVGTVLDLDAADQVQGPALGQAMFPDQPAEDLDHFELTLGMSADRIEESPDGHDGSITLGARSHLVHIDRGKEQIRLDVPEP